MLEKFASKINLLKMKSLTDGKKELKNTFFELCEPELQQSRFLFLNFPNTFVIFL